MKTLSALILALLIAVPCYAVIYEAVDTDKNEVIDSVKITVKTPDVVIYKTKEEIEKDLVQKQLQLIEAEQRVTAIQAEIDAMTVESAKTTYDIKVVESVK